MMGILGRKKKDISVLKESLQLYSTYRNSKSVNEKMEGWSGRLIVGIQRRKPVKYLSILSRHYTQPSPYTALAYHPTITKLNRLALMHFTYVTDVANTTHVLRICNICRICNTCTSHMQHMLHMQHMSHMQHMCFAYATYVAYATHFYKMSFFFKSAR